MASSLSSEISILSLKEELECPICLRQFNYPKLAGDCLHTFCLGCISAHIKNQAAGDSFPCPLCRKLCRTPIEGPSGLKTDFKMASLVDKCKFAEAPTQQTSGSLGTGQAPGQNPTGMTGSLPTKLDPPKIANAPPCGACTKPALNFCEGCHGVNLCETCSSAHATTPFTKDHDLVELCNIHGKPIECFCINCDSPACCLCLLSAHPANSHQIKPFREVFRSAQSGLQFALDNASVANARVQANDKEMASFYCQVLRKCEQEKLDRQETTDETNRKYDWQLGDVRNEIKLVKKKLEALIQQEQDLMLAKGHFLTENGKIVDETNRQWNVIICDMKVSITGLGDSGRGLKGVMDHGDAVKTVKGLSGRNLTALKQTASGVRTRIGDVDHAINTAEKLRFSLKGRIGPMYRFHHLAAHPIRVGHGEMVIERWIWGAGWAIAFTDRPLEDGKPVEVIVTNYNQSKPDWGSAFGVSTLRPDQILEMDSSGSCIYAGGWDFDGSWTVCQNTLRRGGYQTGSYGFNTLNLRKSTKLGIVRRGDGTVNFLVDGQDYGPAFRGVPAGAYGYFCLDGRIAELTMA